MREQDVRIERLNRTVEYTYTSEHVVTSLEMESRANDIENVRV